VTCSAQCLVLELWPPRWAPCDVFRTVSRARTVPPRWAPCDVFRTVSRARTVAAQVGPWLFLSGLFISVG
jgi:hypothetical protein